MRPFFVSRALARSGCDRDRHRLGDECREMRAQTLGDAVGRSDCRARRIARCAVETGSSPSTTRAPQIPSTLRRSCCAQIAPYWPVVAPAMATVLFLNELPRCRADAQSMAFFSTPGIEPLYSGVTIKSASAASMRSRRSSAAAGGSKLALVEVLVVGRKQRQSVVEIHEDAFGRELDGRARESRVVRLRAQAAGDGEDLHVTPP